MMTTYKFIKNNGTVIRCIKTTLVLSLSALLSGCLTSYKPPTSKEYTCKENKPATAQFYDEDSGPIILRYSEDGRVANRCDESLAKSAILELREDKTVLVYIHGWRHDAGTGHYVNSKNTSKTMETMGDDLYKFTKFLDDYRDANKNEPVIGIFVGWRGGMGLPAWLEWMSFENRKRAADRIGNGGGVARLLAAIGNIKKTQEDRDINNHVVFMGHSFGGRLLYHSVMEDYIYSAANNYPNSDNDYGNKEYSNITGIADLVVLMNPALEASSYHALESLRPKNTLKLRKAGSQIRHFTKDQLPLMITLQSEGDNAVKHLFPWGQRLLGLRLSKLSARALGFRDDYITHDLTSLKACPKEREQLKTLYDSFCKSNALLKNRKHDGEYDSPFLVVQVQDTVLRDHSWYPSEKDPDDKIFGSWLIDYMKSHRQKSAKKPNLRAGTNGN